MLRGSLSVEFGPDDVPPFVAAPAWYPAFLDSALSQFNGLDQAYHVLVNSFRDLEPMDGRWMPTRIRRLRPRHPQGGAATTPDPSARAADHAWTDMLPLPRRLHDSHGSHECC